MEKLFLATRPPEPTSVLKLYRNGILANPILSARWNYGSFDFVSSLISLFIAWALLIAVLVFFFTFVRGGIAWINAGGDEKKVEEAQGKLTGALIGLGLVFLIFMILRLIGLFFGIDSLKNTLRLTMPTLPALF